MNHLLELSQSLSSKLCHEMAGLIGAINNCIGLIEATDEVTRHTAKELININSEKLVALLKFYRVSYGISHETEHIGYNELKNLINGFIESHKIQAKFEDLIDPSLPIGLGKIMLCLVISACGNLVKEGQINIGVNIAKNNYSIKLKVSGQSLKLNPNKVEILLEGSRASEISVQNSHEYYLHYLCQKEGYKIAVDQFDDAIEYSVKTQ